MPPKPIVSKEEVIHHALQIIREEGMENLNARTIAKRLNCSTNPLFRLYKNMDELRSDIYQAAENYFEYFLQSTKIENVSLFLQMGLNYISFAKNEKNLFKFIFLSDNLHFNSLYSVANMTNNPEIIHSIMSQTSLTEQLAKDLFSTIWFIAHGIACTVATNEYSYNEGEIKGILINSYQGLIYVMKKEE